MSGIDSELILSIDPGPEVSGVVLLNTCYTSSINVLFADDIESDVVYDFLTGNTFFALYGFRDRIDISDISYCVIEDIVFQGQMVGKSVFETAKRIGDFRTAWNIRKEYTASIIPRGDVLNYLCGGSMFRDPKTGKLRRLTSARVKTSLLSKFAETGGGSIPQIGTKAKPGPLYLMKGKKHAWSALALGITFWETKDIC